MARSRAAGWTGDRRGHCRWRPATMRAQRGARAGLVGGKSRLRPCRGVARRAASTQASSSAMFAPCARKGSVGWAASPRMAAAPGPVPVRGHRVAEQAPEVDILDLVQPAADAGREALEGEAQVHRIVAQGPAFLGPAAAFLDRDDVAQGAAAQGIADEMAARPHVDLGHGRGAGVAGDHGAPGDLTGEERRGRAVQRGADAGMQAIGADQQRRPRWRSPCAVVDAGAGAGQIDGVDPLAAGGVCTPASPRAVEQEASIRSARWRKR